MYLTHVHIDGFKSLTKFSISLKDNVNVIVGDNETGKTSLLEAISLVLTRKYDGRVIDYVIDPYMFNADMVKDYFEYIRAGGNSIPPCILIEAYFNDDEDPLLAKLRGFSNTRNEDCPGLKLTIELREGYAEELKQYASDKSNPTLLPVEFYHCEWRSFSNNGVASKTFPFRTKYIDTSISRTYYGPNRYIAQVVEDVLSEEQRRELSIAYKKLKHTFASDPHLTIINDHIQNQGNLADQQLSVNIDQSSRSSWDSAITAHLDELPFECAGKGQQCRVQMQLAVTDAKSSLILLIEEPENHLSHSNLNALMKDIATASEGRQLIVTTHNAFVLNKLGIDNVTLVSHDRKTATLSEVSSDTKDYFKKLPGYDTLRLILARKCILVEGPSDELIVQRIYRDTYGKLPIEDRTDVIAVGSLAFKRFLEIAKLLTLRVCVVTDNDGDVESLKLKYDGFINNNSPSIKFFFDTDEKSHTLEPQLLKANSLAVLNTVLKTSHLDDDSLLKYMDRNKTDCALKLFETEHKWNSPKYISDAIADVVK